MILLDQYTPVTCLFDREPGHFRNPVLARRASHHSAGWPERSRRTGRRAFATAVTAARRRLYLVGSLAVARAAGAGPLAAVGRLLDLGLVSVVRTGDTSGGISSSTFTLTGNDGTLSKYGLKGLTATGTVFKTTFDVKAGNVRDPGTAGNPANAVRPDRLGGWEVFRLRFSAPLSRQDQGTLSRKRKKNQPVRRNGP